MLVEARARLKYGMEANRSRYLKERMTEPARAITKMRINTKLFLGSVKKDCSLARPAEDKPIKIPVPARASRNMTEPAGQKKDATKRKRVATKNTISPA